MVEQRWLRTVQYPACVIDIVEELTESFFAAPLLSIDETVLRAFPIDPFDVARTRRRPVLTVNQAEALVANASDASASGDLSPTQMRARAALLEELAPVVRTQYTPIASVARVASVAKAARELAAPATYAPLEPNFDYTPAPAVAAGAAVAVPCAVSASIALPEPRPSTPVIMVATARARGWVTGALLALAGVFVGGAFVCAALTRNEARIESMPSVTAAIAPQQ